MLRWIAQERAVSQDVWIGRIAARRSSEGSAESVDLNRETEGMKFGAVRDGNLLSALMIACDGHDGALSTAPKPRHHFQVPIGKYDKYQIDN